MLSRKALTKYQLLYRHLFRCKYLERSLCGTWVGFHTLKDYEIRSQLVGAYALRYDTCSRMCHHIATRTDTDDT